MGYTVVGWLNKNKDPLNDSVVELLKKSTDPFVVGLWDDYLQEGERPRGKKGASFITMGQVMGPGGRIERTVCTIQH